MGFGPDQVDRWAPYQIIAVFRGYQVANTPPATPPPSDDEFRAAIGRTMH